MFDIGFSELLLVMVIGLVVLGPERLPVAVKTVSGWIRALRSLAASVQNELSQELKLQELQESLKKVEKAGLHNLAPELKTSLDELKAAATSLQNPSCIDKDDPLPTIHHPQSVVADPEAMHDSEISVSVAVTLEPVSAPTSATEVGLTPDPLSAQLNQKEPVAVPSSAPQPPNGER